MKYLEVCLQTSIFAPLFNRKHICLDYGVMVAQQVLVLFVQVRILVVQRNKPQKRISFEAYFVLFIICGCPAVGNDIPRNTAMHYGGVKI